MINLGSEQAVEAAGKSYRLGKLKLRHIRAFRDWVAARVGDPFATAERFVDRLPPAEAMTLVKEAEQLKRELEGFRMLCPLGQRFLFTEEGMAFVTGLLLEEHHSGVGEDEVQAVADELAGRVVEALAKAMGESPNAGGPGVPPPPAGSIGTPSTDASSSAAPA